MSVCMLYHCMALADCVFLAESTVHNVLYLLCFTYSTSNSRLFHQKLLHVVKILIRHAPHVNLLLLEGFSTCEFFHTSINFILFLFSCIINFTAAA